MAFQYDPPGGYRDTTAFPTKPANETEFRNSMMTLLDQVATEINTGAESGLGATGQNAQTIINGNLDIWQRGVLIPYANNFGVGNSAGYGPDRWWGQVFRGTGGTDSNTGFQFERQIFTPGQTEVPNNPLAFCRMFVNATGTEAPANAVIRFQQNIQSAFTYSGQKCTASFWLKADFDRQMAVSLEQSFGNGGSPSVSCPGGVKFDVTTEWQHFSVTFDVPSIALKNFGTENCLRLIFIVYKKDNDPIAIPAGTVGTYETGSVDFSQVQFNEGDAPRAFQPRVLADEFQDCQFYYQKSYNLNVKPQAASQSSGRYGGRYGAAANTIVEMQVQLRVAMRKPPAVTLYSIDGTLNKWQVNNVTNIDASVASQGDASFTAFATNNWANNDLYAFHWTADAEIS